ncbi:flagellar hook-associated protein FlgK [Geobacter sp. FeAm09]|uniref:flagellar hook-associated protein FlgK n=1 Tax=Geobacter sp. FeAm09 TaxID=2597769 RepID=UPI0011EC7FA9|nr:flagellar hook-associated protein FlgK [Geobacter sp. FeAm09]QEM68024.1 flagellar hook-associated protein FlgK [Geobacter sp. FeAm09]
MSLSSALQIGRSGLGAYQTAIDVTGENIANVNTAGYSRQTAELETAPQTTTSGLSLGNGVSVASIARSYDALLQSEIVGAQTEQGYDTTTYTALQAVEPSFNEVSTDGLGAAISDFFGSWQDLTNNPTGTAERQSVLTAAQNLVDNFNSVSKTLSDSITGENTSLVTLTDSINQNLTSIADLNGQIRTIEQAGGNANELKDQRDQKIQDLSQQIGITYTENSDGTTDVNFADSGAALVSGTKAGSFSLVTNAATGLYDVSLTAAGDTAAVQVTPASGKLGATIDLRDSILPEYQSKIDALATGIATAVNAQQQAGYDLTGAAGIALFSPATSGATIAVNAAITSTDQIAASSSASAKGDSGNALLLADLANDTSAMSGSTFGGYYNNLVTQVGQDVQNSKNNVTQDEAYTTQLSTLRESNSGVSLDEELINLTKYQKSYAASAKLITTVSDMMDTVLGLIR